MSATISRTTWHYAQEDTDLLLNSVHTLTFSFSEIHINIAISSKPSFTINIMPWESVVILFVILIFFPTLNTCPVQLIIVDLIILIHYIWRRVHGMKYLTMQSSPISLQNVFSWPQAKYLLGSFIEREKVLLHLTFSRRLLWKTRSSRKNRTPTFLSL
jgi:hypothetical protein